MFKRGYQSPTPYGSKHSKHASSSAPWARISRTLRDVSQVRIRAVAAGGGQGDIAIDNLTIQKIEYRLDRPDFLANIQEGTSGGDGEGNYDSSDDDYYTITWTSVKRALWYEIQINDGGWADIGHTFTATFNSLNPGENRMEVRPCNESGCYEADWIVVNYYEED